jgi:3-deoxy-7-phosphoheptulonate synthase
MIIVLKPEVTDSQLKHLVSKIKSLGLKPMISKGIERTIIGVIGEEDVLRSTPLDVFPGVEKVMSILAPYKLVSREFKHENSVIHIGKIKIGGKKIAMMAGPCSIESREMLISIAKSVKRAGASVLRGGAFKPRTSPYSFQGWAKKALSTLKKPARRRACPL